MHLSYLDLLILILFGTKTFDDRKWQLKETRKHRPVMVLMHATDYHKFSLASAMTESNYRYVLEGRWFDFK